MGERSGAARVRGWFGVRPVPAGLVLAVALAAGVMAWVGVSAVGRIERVQATTAAAWHDQFQPLSCLGQLTVLLHAHRATIRALGVPTDPTRQDAALRLLKLDSQIDAALGQLAFLEPTSLGRLKNGWAISQAARKQLAAAPGGSHDLAWQTFDAADAELTTTVEELLAGSAREADTVMRAQAERTVPDRVTLLLPLVAGMGLTVVIGIVLARVLVRLHGTMQAVSGQAASLSSAAAQLSGVSLEMTDNADTTVTRAGGVEEATRDVNMSVELVVMGIEDMNASIKEIAKNVTEALKVATSAVQVAEMTNADVGALGRSSAEIGTVIKLITSIAGQTNFLALNATIEAARAGDAGHGFAVVANEVKELAKETAKATDDISPTLEAIQADSKRAVESISQICTIIGQINDLQGAIASAVEEQTATAREMVRGVNEVSERANRIAEGISDFARAARSDSDSAKATQHWAREVAATAAALQQLVGSPRRPLAVPE